MLTFLAGMVVGAFVGGAVLGYHGRRTTDDASPTP